MKYLTHKLQDKYNYYNFILFNERKQIFMYEDTSQYYFIDMSDDTWNIELFLMTRNTINLYKNEIMKLWNYHEKRKNQMIKRFEKERIIIKRRSYRTILINIFCDDITDDIIKFII